MSERAEGFWWVRWGAEWEVVKVEQRYDVPRMLQVRFSGVEEASDLAYAERYEIREWGPYLGKEPAPFGLYPQPPIDPEEARRIAATDPDNPLRGVTMPVIRMEPAGVGADFNPSTDYEGEDTRALDGAGEPKPSDREPKP